MSRPPLRRTAIALALVAVALPLAACTSTVALDPAPRADTVGCADVVVRLPSTLESLSRHDTNAQGTGAWGSPASIVLTCGVTTPRVSDQNCYPVEGVDWLIDYRGDEAVYTTYGRNPGVQVVVDTKAVPAATNVLFDLSSAVGTLPQNRTCQGPSDIPGSPTPTATPAP
ncbi:DUF3515 family protein [Frondihabitans peucedani]|uniref:DUF3515 domain-containing protein n=1 Tax=Frondihabitans peucedani TaxID=598626 RepID=A0ABP8DZ99_9MICO